MALPPFKLLPGIHIIHLANGFLKIQLILPIYASSENPKYQLRSTFKLAIEKFPIEIEQNVCVIRRSFENIAGM